MSPRSLALLTCLSSAALVFGCGPADPEPPVPDQAVDCPTQFGEDTMETREVELGDASSGELVPYPEGEEVALIHGSQGLSMITPWVSIEAAADDGEEACCVVRLENEADGPLADEHNFIGSNQFNVLFAREGSVFLSDGALYHPLGPDHDVLAGQTVKVTATVRCDGFEGETSVTVSLK